MENNNKPELYGVVKYFDDHFDSLYAENVTKERAYELIENLASGVYVSYQMRTMDEINKHFKK